MNQAAAQLGFAFDAADALSVRKLARASDPETSQIAAARTISFRANHAGRILAALQDHGPMTVDQIAKVTDLTGWQVSRRMCELQRVGVATVSGETRLSASGRPERIWSAK